MSDTPTALDLQQAASDLVESTAVMSVLRLDVRARLQTLLGAINEDAVAQVLADQFHGTQQVEALAVLLDRLITATQDRESKQSNLQDLAVQLV
jgi:hypothetical protein